MCDDSQIELDDSMKCDLCEKKPACNLLNHLTGEADLGYKGLCERCGITVFGRKIVTEWAGTKLYLKKYPSEAEAWQ